MADRLRKKTYDSLIADMKLISKWTSDLRNDIVIVSFLIFS